VPDETPSARERVTTRFRAERGPLADAEQRIGQLLAEEAPLLAARDRERRARELAGDLVGLGALERLLDDPAVTDVLVNGPGPVWVERLGVLQRTTVEMDRTQILRAVERLVAPLGLRADRAHPVVDGRLGDGTRVSVVLDPVAVDGPLIALRRHMATQIPLHELAGAAAGALRSAVQRRDNILVYGATGSGKTTLLNSLVAEVEPSERIVVIEDVAELRLPGEHVVRLEVGARTAEDHDGLGLRELVRASLRLRPDRIVVGEVRGSEALDMVWALSTGHTGCMSTLHAASPQDAVARLETMIVLGTGEAVPVDAVRRQVLSALGLLVGVARRGGARREVVAVHTCGPDGVHPLEERA